MGKAAATQAAVAESASPIVAVITRPNLSIMEVPLVGISSLLSHNFSNKSRKEMLDKQQKKGGKVREVRDPEREFLDSLYVIDPALPIADRYGFPSAAFKNAAVSACRNLHGIPMTLARGAFHVMRDLTPIAYERLVCREDVVRVGMGAADLRYRGEFQGWSAVLKIRINLGVMSYEQLLNLLEAAGFAVGVGDWRTEKDGQFGQFEVVRG